MLHVSPEADGAGEIVNVQRHAGANDVHNILMEHAGGQQMQGEFAHIVDNGVPGVAAALIPHHHIVLPCQVIHHAAFTLVAPVDPHDRAISHIHCLLVCVHFKQRLIIRAGVE